MLLLQKNSHKSGQTAKGVTENSKEQVMAMNAAKN